MSLADAAQAGMLQLGTDDNMGMSKVSIYFVENLPLFAVLRSHHFQRE